jgi:hypothetical protein
MDAFRKLFHELVIDAEVGQRPAERAARRSQSRAKQRIEEKHADQQAPEAARNSAGRCCVNDLVQLNFAVGGFSGDDRIPEFDDVFFLRFEQALSHLFGFFLGRITTRSDIGSVPDFTFAGARNIMCRHPHEFKPPVRLFMSWGSRHQGANATFAPRLIHNRIRLGPPPTPLNRFLSRYFPWRPHQNRLE